MVMIAELRFLWNVSLCNDDFPRDVHTETSAMSWLDSSLVMSGTVAELICASTGLDPSL